MTESFEQNEALCGPLRDCQKDYGDYFGRGDTE
jgi:hypothetical protein